MPSVMYLLLCSSRAPQLPMIKGAVRDNVKEFTYSYEASTLDDILVGVHQKLQGQRVNGIAILLHSLEAEMLLCFAENRVINEFTVSTDSTLRSFFLHLTQSHLVSDLKERRLDFLNSCLMSPLAETVADHFRQLLKIPVGIWKDPFGIDNKIGNFYFDVPLLHKKLEGFESAEEKLHGYEKIRTVGKGAFGTAVLYKNTSSDTLVVIKEINMTELTAVERQMALNEVQVLSVLNHPNIVRSFELDGVLMIEMEYADGGTLAQLLHRQNQPLPECDILSLFRQIVSAIQHMHQHNILHRDLKTANVFLTKDKAVKVGDFGISKAMTTRAQAQTVLGTPYYISPEMCEGKQYDQKSDMWALGCILYEMACLKKAFQGSNLPALVNNIMRGQFQKVPEHYSPELRQIINQLLQRDPNLRPTANELFNSSIPKAMDSLSKREKDWYSESNFVDNYGSSSRNNNNERSILYELKAFQTAFTLTPLALPAQIKIKQVAVSNTHFIVLTTELTVLTWGEGYRGQLGQGDTPSWRDTPTPVHGLGDRSIKFIAAGDGFSIFVSDSGMLMTCGDGSFGCLGHSDWNNLSRPKLIEKLLETDVSVVRCGARHVAVLASDGDMYTWGQAEGGRLGLGHERDCCTPTRVSIGNDIILRDIQCGVDCTVAVTSKGSLLACGRNTYNKLGLSCKKLIPPGYQTIEKSLTFRRVNKITARVEKVSIGPSHTCILREDGAVITMGRNIEGQLGHSTKLHEAGPGIVHDLDDIAVKSLVAGPTYTLATSQENVIFMWGTRYTEFPRSSASLGNRSSQALAASNLSNRILEELLVHPKELLALYSSPKQIMKGNVLTVGEVFALPNSVLILVHTTVPLVNKLNALEKGNTSSKACDKSEPDPDADSLGPIPDWMKAEVANSEALWGGYTTSSVHIDYDA